MAKNQLVSLAKNACWLFIVLLTIILAGFSLTANRSSPSELSIFLYLMVIPLFLFVCIVGIIEVINIHLTDRTQVLVRLSKFCILGLALGSIFAYMGTFRSDTQVNGITMVLRYVGLSMYAFIAPAVVMFVAKEKQVVGSIVAIVLNALPLVILVSYEPLFRP